MSSSTHATTVVAQGARIEGDLHLNRDAVIHGTVTGNVHSQAHVEIAPDAVIAGDLHAVSLTLAGRIAGRAVIAQTTQLLAGGDLQGPLETRHLTAAEGATYDGQLRMRQASDTAAPQPAPAITPRRQQGPRHQVDALSTLPEVTGNANANTFTPIPSTPGIPEVPGVPGSVNAAIRPRRRVPRAS